MSSVAATYHIMSKPDDTWNVSPKIKPDYVPTKHRDGSVSYWSVYRQVWVRTACLSTVPDEELAAMGPDRRKKIGCRA